MHIFFSIISLFIRQSPYQEIKISHRETDPASSLQWRERKWAELYQEVKIRLALLPHQVFIAKDLFLLHRSVKEKPQTSHLPQWINWVSSTKPFTERALQQSLLGSSVCAAEWMGRFCKAPCQPSAIITSRGTDGNAAASMNLHPVFFPEVAVETVSPGSCSVCVCTCKITKTTAACACLLLLWAQFLHFSAEHWALLIVPTFPLVKHVGSPWIQNLNRFFTKLES